MCPVKKIEVFFFNCVKRRAVRHKRRGSERTRQRTRPKDGIYAGDIDGSIIFCNEQRLRRVLYTVHSTANRRRFPTVSYSAHNLQSANQTGQPFLMAAAFDGSLCERALHASTRPCKHASTCLPKFGWILSLCLTFVTYCVFGIDPSGVLVQ